MDCLSTIISSTSTATLCHLANYLLVVLEIRMRTGDLISLDSVMLNLCQSIAFSVFWCMCVQIKVFHDLKLLGIFLSVFEIVQIGKT